jgi:hypothetical protein
MQRKQHTTLFRSRNARSRGKNFQLTPTDLENITTINTAFERKHRVSVSMGLAMSLALEAMTAEIAGGLLRVNPEVSEGLARVKAAR